MKPAHGPGGSLRSQLVVPLSCGYKERPGMRTRTPTERPGLSNAGVVADVTTPLEWKSPEKPSDQAIAFRTAESAGC